VQTRPPGFTPVFCSGLRLTRPAIPDFCCNNFNTTLGQKASRPQHSFAWSLTLRQVERVGDRLERGGADHDRGDDHDRGGDGHGPEQQEILLDDQRRSWCLPECHLQLAGQPRASGSFRTLGFSGYRIHRTDLPGKPDIAFMQHKKAIQVHGCFWHGHTCLEGSRKPKSNQAYWLPKIARNRARDEVNSAKLALLGWSVLTVWECELQSPNLADRLATFMAACPKDPLIGPV